MPFMLIIEFPSLPAGYDPRSHEYEYFRIAVSKYVQRFKTVYKLITAKAPEDHIPSLHKYKNKPGIIDIFLQAIPFGLGKKILSFSPRRYSVDIDDFSDFSKFFRKGMERYYSNQLAGVASDDGSDDSEARCTYSNGIFYYSDND